MKITIILAGESLRLAPGFLSPEAIRGELKKAPHTDGLIVKFYHAKVKKVGSEWEPCGEATHVASFRRLSIGWLNMNHLIEG